jgi:hypothetical protein
MSSGNCRLVMAGGLDAVAGAAEGGVLAAGEAAGTLGVVGAAIGLVGAGATDDGAAAGAFCASAKGPTAIAAIRTAVNVAIGRIWPNRSAR